MTHFAAIDFETAIRLAVSLGGDSDTLACITGGLAEAYYQEIPEEFVVYAFIWAYSLRAQYTNLGWLSAQNYILGWSDKINSFNMYQLISKQDTSISLLSALADKLSPLSNYDIKDGWAQECYEYSDKGEILKNLKDEKDGVYENYLYFFQANGFYK